MIIRIAYIDAIVIISDYVYFYLHSKNNTSNMHSVMKWFYLEEDLSEKCSVSKFVAKSSV